MTYTEKNGVQNFTIEHLMPWNFLIVNIFCSVSFLFLEHKHPKFSLQPQFFSWALKCYIFSSLGK